MSLNIAEIFANVSGGKPVTTDGIPEISLEIPFDLDLSGEVVTAEPEPVDVAEDDPADVMDLGENLPVQVAIRPSPQASAQLPNIVTAPTPEPRDADNTTLPITNGENVSSTLVEKNPAVPLADRASEVAVTSVLPIQTSQSPASVDTPVKFADPASREPIPTTKPDDLNLVKLASHDPKKDDFLLPRTDEAPRLAEQPKRSFIASPSVKAETTAEITTSTLSKPPTPSSTQPLLFDTGLANLVEQSEAPVNRRSLPTSFQNVHASHRVPISPQIIATQISTSISKSSGDLIEIRLDPPELGRLIVSITQSESGVSAHVSAEKSDIAEFLRRNANILSQELEKSGFGGASLEFSHKGFHQNDGNSVEDEGRQIDGTASHETASSRNPQINYILHGGLDIRL